MAGIVLLSETALVNKDLKPAYDAFKQDFEVTARFKKKEDVTKLAKSILKHRIQTLTGKNIKSIEEEMKYKPKNPNDIGMNEEMLKKLAHCLILLANGKLEELMGSTQENGKEDPEPEPVPTPSTTLSRKRPAASNGSDTLSTTSNGATKSKLSRKSIAVSKIEEPVANLTPRRGRRSLAVPQNTTPLLAAGNKTSPRKRNQELSDSTISEASVTLRCPAPAAKEGKPALSQTKEEDNEEEEEAEDLGGLNPTPAMKELLKKRRSVGASLTPSGGGKSTKTQQAKKKITKVVEEPPSPPPSPPPRTEFVGTAQSEVFLLSADPMALTHSKLVKALPAGAKFPGAHLAVVHTPAVWSPREVFHIVKNIKTLNNDAGLDSFVILIGTGLLNVHLNMEAVKRHTQHVQFVTFHREDANQGTETGMLRETTSFFLVGYFFPGCEKEDSTLPYKMVRDGYTTCFRTESVASLEQTIIDCFSEQGEWLLDLFSGKRKLSLAAAEKGRSSVAVHTSSEDLEDLGNYLRTLALRSDLTFRDKDGMVIEMK